HRHNRTPPTRTNWTRSTLQKERRDFFETRVTGREEVWGSIKLATELLRDGDVAEAQGVLDASGVTVPTGDLVDGCYDEQGALYQVPAWVVAEPEGVVEDDDAKEGDIIDGGGGDGGTVENGGDVDTKETKGKEVVVVGHRAAEEEEEEEEERIRVKARLSDRGGPDIVLIMGKEERVTALVRRIQKEAN
ncbi:MAG: hypothetical protein L6R39_007848, partial [Caloplaca ligustica]